MKQQKNLEVGIMQVIETRLLYYFLTVARERNITNAARTLHITQPTLSRQMALLEEEVGAKLFIRDSRPLSDMIPSSRTQKYKNLTWGGILCPEKVKLMQ